MAWGWGYIMAVQPGPPSQVTSRFYLRAPSLWDKSKSGLRTRLALSFSVLLIMFFISLVYEHTLSKMSIFFVATQTIYFGMGYGDCNFILYQSGGWPYLFNLMYSFRILPCAWVAIYWALCARSFRGTMATAQVVFLTLHCGTPATQHARCAEATY